MLVDGSCVATYIRHLSPQRPTSRPTRSGYRSCGVLLGVALCAACDASPRSDAADNARLGAQPAPETTLRAAPFQSSAITLIGTVSRQTEAWTFQRFTAELHVKASIPTALEVAIDTGSTATNNPALKVRLADRDLLDVVAHPQATFRATELRELSRAGDVVTYAATGVLALAGRTNSATIPLEISHSSAGTEVHVTANIDRRAWQTALLRGPEGVFDDRLQIQARLIFPNVDSR